MGALRKTNIDEPSELHWAREELRDGGGMASSFGFNLSFLNGSHA